MVVMRCKYLLTPTQNKGDPYSDFANFSKVIPNSTYFLRTLWYNRGTVRLRDARELVGVAIFKDTCVDTCAERADPKPYKIAPIPIVNAELQELSNDVRMGSRRAKSTLI